MTSEVRAITKTADEREAERTEVEIAAGLRSHPGRRVPVLLRNVSSDGFMAEGGETLVPGMPVMLDLFDGRGFPARIVWKREGYCGGAFTTPLDAATLASFV
jgi:PilZ domain